MSGNIWVLAEHWRGNLSEITFELLALGRQVADDLGVPMEAVLLGHEAKGLAAELGVANNVIAVEHPTLENPNPEPCVAALTALAREREPKALLLPMTNVVADLLGLLPARLGAPFANLCKDLRVTDGALEARCVLYGGKMEATVALTGAPALLGILPGVRKADEGRSEAAPAIEDVAVELPADPRVRFEDYIEPEAGDVDIAQQPVLVSVGRGIETEDNIELAEDLARALGGAVCASRPVIDQGWLPLSRQVGKSGAIVKPKLYVAIGISGAPEHVEGMKDADLIVAINTDPQAPIFNAAHVGVVESGADMLEVLNETLHARKG
ncbi:MAG: electron transfer flavoprotein subunit alpha/FixB family protein [Planctomycetota bacterium]|jgi:electron transfer flavoprotein alpha subunit